MIFGVFTDCHYANREVNLERFYAHAPDKLSQCLSQLRRDGASFLLNLGDTVDTVGDPAAAVQRLQEAVRIWEEFPGDVYLLLGNHDILELTKEEIRQITGSLSTEGKSYYTFAREGIRFFCLDSCYDRFGTSYEAVESDWQEEYVTPCQLDWLKTSLDRMDEERAVVCCHANLDSRLQEDGSEDPHILKNAAQVREILENSGRRIAVLQGHYHPGTFTIQKGIPYITFRAMTLGAFPEHNAFALVEITPDSIFVRGYGQQEDYRALF